MRVSLASACAGADSGRVFRSLAHRDVIFESFSVLVDEFGAQRVIDLVPGGRDIEVVEGNKAAYVDAVIEWRLGSQGAMKDQIRELRAGFRE